MVNPKWLIILFSVITLVSLFSMLNVSYCLASPTYVSQPYIINAKYEIGAPWDEIKVGVNITSSESIENVTLFYSLQPWDPILNRPTEWTDYHTVSMIHEYSANLTTVWVHNFTTLENSTSLWIFVSVLDSTGREWSDYSTPDTSLVYNIYTKAPTFRLNYFGIDAINEKELTANITFSVHIVVPFDTSQISLEVFDGVKDRHLFVNQTAGRFEFNQQFNWNGVELLGDPTAIPFDSYHINITFYVSLKCNPLSQIETISIGNYNDRAVWKHSFSIDLKEGNRTQISVSNLIQRKIENVYFFIIPTIVSFILLGSSHLLPSFEAIRSRLTIYLTIFVFLLGSFSVNEILRNMIPNIAYGITAAELTLTWLAAYLGIYCFSSFLSYFAKDFKVKGVDIGVLFDLAAFIIVIILFIFLPVVKIESPFITQSHTLFEHLKSFEFKLALIVGMGYGVALQLLKLIILKVKYTEDVYASMDY